VCRAELVGDGAADAARCAGDEGDRVRRHGFTLATRRHGPGARNFAALVAAVDTAGLLTDTLNNKCSP
jgi:hypothetical protein